MKASPGEAGADGKERGYLQTLAIWKMGDSCLKAHLPLSVEAEVFIRRERGQNRDCLLYTSDAADEDSPV